MEFIKRIWNNVKAYFATLRLVVAVKEVVQSFKGWQASKVKTEQVKKEWDQRIDESKQETEFVQKLGDQFHRIAELAGSAFSLEEAHTAFKARDEVTLTRIEEEVKAGTYKGQIQPKTANAKMRKPGKKAA